MKSIACLVLLSLSCCLNQAAVILPVESTITGIPDTATMNTLELSETVPKILESEKTLHKMHMIQDHQLGREQLELLKRQIMENQDELIRLAALQQKHMIEQDEMAQLEDRLEDKHMKEMIMMDKVQKMKMMPDMSMMPMRMRMMEMGLNPMTSWRNIRMDELRDTLDTIPFRKFWTGMGTGMNMLNRVPVM